MRCRSRAGFGSSFFNDGLSSALRCYAGANRSFTAKGREGMPSVREMLEAALERHQAGRLDEAESLYRQVLAIEPDNADCLHLLGMLADQKGRSDEAIGLITR